MEMKEIFSKEWISKKDTIKKERDGWLDLISTE